MSEKNSVLFVCLGNICRSPAAEGVFRHVVAEAGREGDFEIDSAGTGSWHVGNPADKRMRAAAQRRGYALDSIARQLVSDDFERFDLILAMDDDNLRNVTALGNGNGRARVVLMREFCEQHGPGEVPDPYFGGDEGFEEVLDILEDACRGLLRHL
ncbi:low molecular weight protein-tyrosine-phosphatase [Elongatibacter sediminis]|uniref:Low molecular weight protein-tyrosine-phosphatase n=1 Tax=Elongatibacter sediminis TaxID=3119006 RepID=A0AAW9REB3_9GAMM